MVSVRKDEEYSFCSRTNDVASHVRVLKELNFSTYRFDIRYIEQRMEETFLNEGSLKEMLSEISIAESDVKEYLQKCPAIVKEFPEISQIIQLIYMAFDS